MDDNIPSSNQKSGGGSAVILIVVVIAITAIAVSMVPDNAEKPAPTAQIETKEAAPSSTPAKPKEPSMATTEPAAPSIVSPVENEAASTEAGTPPKASKPGDAARELIARLRQYGNIDLASLHQEAIKQHQEGAKEDAYMLYFFAAREGHAESALALAEQADPRFYDAATSVFENADATQAYKWYAKAIDNGSSNAQNAMTELRKSIQQQAERGDQAAQRLILQWQ